MPLRTVQPTRPPARAIRAVAARPRIALLLAAVLALALAGAVGGLAVVRRRQAGRLAGPIVAPPAPAADFTLRDQDGRPVHLAALRGKVVVLTFLYTHCPDVCPLIAGKLAYAQRDLAPEADKVVFLAVSVDPVGDTPAAVRQFDAARGLTGANWHYLLGTRAALTPVWASYYVGAEAGEVPGAPAARVSTPGAGLVFHTATVYVLDPRQRERVAFDADFAVDDLVHDVRAFAGP
ncbi:MAG TPA: SCO family protein [Thermomicrobiales bacterium]|nr:SCO family protein [Thermomicrobiales bacterium]